MNKDEMTSALVRAEETVEAAMIVVGALPQAIKEWHSSADLALVLMNEPLVAVGAAMAKLGDAMMHLSSAHHRVDMIHAHQAVPE